MTILTTEKKYTISLKNASGKEIFDEVETLFPHKRMRMESGAYIATELDACKLINWWRHVVDKMLLAEPASAYTLRISEKPLTCAEKVARLADVFRIADEAARRWECAEDGGTCNFDCPAIRLFRWRDADVKKAATMAGVTAYKWEGNFYNWHIFGNFKGQADRRTAMAEEFKDVLTAAGYDCMLYCQAD